MSNIPKEFQTAEGLRTLANYLRSSNGIKVRHGVEHDKRVEYFKGKRLIECVLEAKKWPKSIPQIKDKGVANVVASLLVQGNYFHRSEKVEEKKGHLRICKLNVFEENGYYTWMYAGNQTWSNILTGAVIAIVIGFTLLPIWPNVAKKVLWYLSVTFLICTLAFCLIRFLLFLVCWIFGYDVWIFPRLFDESLSFQDSFKPVYSVDKAAAGQGYYRIGSLLCILGFTYWACTQPTEFDGLLKVQKDFIDDLYSGKLLADVAHDHKIVGDRTRKMPSLEDLIREMERENIAETAFEADATGAAADGSTDGLDADDSAKKYKTFDTDGTVHDIDETSSDEAQSEQDKIDEQRLNDLLEKDE